ncbi:MAG: LCP family protein [Actinomycetia bacterium]|nr:LCP family protein [Actinomycetes bacterium]
MITIGVVIALVASIVGTVLAYRTLDANIERIDLIEAIGTERPTAEVEGPLNILVLGSDTRQGIGTSEYGIDTVEGGPHSDTNMLLHLSADRSRAIVVSIPRDSMTLAPRNCYDRNAKVEDGVIRQWNVNFNKGGAPCVIRTFEGNTNILVDHFVVIDFLGFQKMVDALGGIPVCLPEDIDDPQAHFQMPAGRHVLDGREALGYVRLRKSVGDGSDLGRIQRQQTFLMSVAQKATSMSLLLRPDRLYSFLDAATESMTTDRDLSTAELARIANSIRSLGLNRVQFVTVPTEVYEPDPNRVQWAPEADDLWEAIRFDRPLGEEESTATQTETETATLAVTPAPRLTVAPDEIAVSVANASGVSGLANQTVAALAVQGFLATVGPNMTPGEVTGTVIRHSPDHEEAARTVQAAFPDSVLLEDDTLGPTIVVQMGAGALNPVEVANRVGTEPLPDMPLSAAQLSTETGTLSVRTADEDICG